MFLTTHILLLSCFSIVMSRHMDFKPKVLEEKKLKSRNVRRMAILNSKLLRVRSTEVLDDIPHYRYVFGSKSAHWKKIRAIEKDFRRLLAMSGIKYDYKRDLYWRTWRRIMNVNGLKQTVCYKCNNLIKEYGRECRHCGTWTIEDQPPPCPYEFFSVISDTELCGANYTQYKEVTDSCPSVIKFSDLTATCDNPIETQWRFTKLYGVQEKYDDVICKNQDFCEIFTSYEISPAHVIFRIINSTNDVIYSRVMMPNHKNYICAEDCGRLNPMTSKIEKPVKSLRVDLPNANRDKINMYKSSNPDIVIPTEENISLSFETLAS